MDSRGLDDNTNHDRLKGKPEDGPGTSHPTKRMRTDGPSHRVRSQPGRPLTPPGVLPLTVAIPFTVQLLSRFGLR